jgi:hypothetical protein
MEVWLREEGAMEKGEDVKDAEVNKNMFGLDSNRDCGSTLRLELGFRSPDRVRIASLSPSSRFTSVNGKCLDGLVISSMYTTGRKGVLSNVYATGIEADFRPWSIKKWL